MKNLLSLLILCGSCCSTVVADSSTTWEQAGALSAPEAHQAAAADRSFLYAIANTKIAKYDRKTGKQVAVSTGPARHLNSGFLWKEKLYCAHSNYPQKPERSQIKVLNPDTMELTTFKDFGNYGGSLTWAIRHLDCWWCNFAHYGDQNGKTFLVNFDEQWKEKGRWAYPKEVLEQLGRYSLSGGLWWGTHLLVTGHDDPVLFRLRLSARGDRLEYLGKEMAPFTGQGIAIDPLTGGLVGINRAKKQVVMATRKPYRLRVLSYNIHHGEGTDRKLDLQRIAKVILSAKPDLVALQEVDQKVERSRKLDQPAELARLTGMKVVFGSNIRFQGGNYGNAILSKLPIVRHRNHKLPNFDKGEQRGLLEAEIQIPGEKPLLFLATHLDHRRKEAERVASAQYINKLITDRKGDTAILAGDLNATPDSNPLKELKKQWQQSNTVARPTVPVKDPKRQIDYILFRPGGAWKAVETKVLQEPVASDHLPVLAILELRGK